MTTVQVLPRAGLNVLRLEDRINPGTGTFTAGRFDFSVAVLFDATAAQQTAIRDRFQAGSDILADATDGQHRFGTITILNNAGTTARARSEFWVSSAAGRANATYGLYGIPGAHINMFFPSDFASANGFDGDAYTIAHEFGHHGYGIADEYSGSGLSDGANCATTSTATLNYSLMDNYYTRGGHAVAGGPYTLNEFCVASNHDPDGNTTQSTRNGVSAWETVAASRFAITAPAGLPVDAPPASVAVGFVTVANASNDLLQMMLLVDRSGSMAGDRLTFTIGGARGLARGVAGFDANVGLASFSDLAAVNDAPSRLGTAANLTDLLGKITGLAAAGQTNIGGGLQTALGQIPAGGTSSRSNIIVLLSDGDHNVGTDPDSVLPALRAAGVTVLVIGVGNTLTPSGEATLQRIARDTGGSYVRVRDNTFGLLGSYFTFYGVATGSAPVARSPVLVGDGRSALELTTPVESGAARGDFFVTHDLNAIGDDFDYSLRLTSPGGASFDAFADPLPPGVSFVQDQYLSGFRVANPAAGDWRVTVVPRRGLQVPPGGGSRFQFQGLVEAPGTYLSVGVVNDLGVYPAPVTVTAVPYYRGQPVVGATVSGSVSRPDGSAVPLTLFDDGSAANGDVQAGDGIYSARFNRYSDGGNGTYQFDLVAVAGAGARTYGGEAGLFPGGAGGGEAVAPFTRAGSATAVASGVPQVVPPAAGLTVRLIPPAGDVRDGQRVTYQVVVTNGGATDVTGVRVNQKLPGGVQIITATSDRGTPGVSGGNVDLAVDRLRPGESATVSVVVIVRVEGSIGSTATVSSTDQVVASLADTRADNVLPVRRSSPAERLPDVTAVGAGFGRSGPIRLYAPDKSVRATLDALPGFTGGVRTATADFNGDGVPDFVVGTGPGRATSVVVYDGATLAALFTLEPFETSFTGGVFVAAGDITGDGVPDLVVTPDEGGGPRVRVFSGAGFTIFADFFGIDDPAFRGGARATVGDLNGDGAGDLIVSAGFGGGPRVAGFSGRALFAGAQTRLFLDFFAFEDTLRNGAYVAAGDFDGDGFADLLAGGGPGGGPRVSAFDGRRLLANQQTRTLDFFAGDPANRDGVRLAVKNLDNDGRADFVAGAGRGGRVTGYAGRTLTGGGAPAEFLSLDAFADAPGGVFVG